MVGRMGRRVGPWVGGWVGGWVVARFCWKSYKHGYDPITRNNKSYFRASFIL